MMSVRVQSEIVATRTAFADLRLAIDQAFRLAQKRAVERAIIRLALAYAGHMGLTVSTVSTYAATDGKWIGNLQNGASCTIRKAEVVVQWFSANWPDDLEWPRNVPRPRPAKGEAA